MIDIVVPYVNPNDKNWQELHSKFNKCKGDNSRQRTRDINIFKYFFRGVAKNCEWVRKIHLLVQSPSQIPSWLDTSNPKIHVVYHEEYIPKELLPTFNTFIIEGFLHRIPELSEHFIYCNDDFFFVNKTKEDDFFRNELPVDNDKLTKYLTANPIHDKIYNGIGWVFFQNVLKSNQILEKQITGKCPIYFNFHTPCVFNKSLIDDVWEKHNDILMAALKESKFRREYNFNAWLFRYIQLDRGAFVKSDSIITDFSYKELGVSTMKEIMLDLFTKKFVCLNDMIKDTDEDIISYQMNKLFDVIFPYKCEYEK